MQGWRFLVLVGLAALAVPLASMIVQDPAPPADPAAAAVARCGGETDIAAERRCYESVLREPLRGGGVRAALALLDRMAALDPAVRRDGHLYAHGIGIAALASPGEVGPVFASCTPGWQSGCYHGVLQAWFLATRRAGGAVDTAAVDALCGDWRGPGGDPWLLFQCTHGLGHGLTMYHGHDLPRALAGCDLLSRPAERENCYGGAFMENIVNATEPHHVAPPGEAQATAGGDHGAHGRHGPHGDAAGAETFRALDPGDLHYPCSIVAPKYLDACYTIQTAAMLYFTRQDVRRTAAECARAPARVRETCFISLGRDVSSMAGPNLREGVRLCGLADAAYRPTCHAGVARSVINMNADPAAGVAYCRIVPPADGKAECYRNTGWQALVLVDGAARRAQACAAAEEGYADICLGRAPQVPQNVTVEARRR